MPRPKRLQFPGAFYHVFNRGINKKTVCFSRHDYQLFLHYLNDTWLKNNFSIHAFCLMKNHYHLLIETHDECLPKVMQQLVSKFAKHLNQKLNADGPVFKDRYKSILIDSNQYLLNVMRYIHLNPIKANLCPSPAQYPWSSFNSYTSKSFTHDFLSTSTILAHFKTKSEFVYYHQFGIDQETLSFYSKKNIQPIYGNEKFKKSLQKGSDPAA